MLVGMRRLRSSCLCCAVKTVCRNVVRPRDVQASREPLDISAANHFAE